MKNIMHAITVALMLFTASSCMDASAIQEREAQAHQATAKIVKVETPKDLGKISKLSAAEFKASIAENKGILVDVRTPEEYAAGHIEGAVNVNFKKRTFPSFISAIAKDKAVWIYCRSGNRSGKSALIMQALGFKDVYELATGVKGWKAESMPLVTTENDANKALQASLKENPPQPTALAHLGQGKDADVAEFEQLIQGNITLVDVRTPAEYSAGHIKGAINIDWKNRHFAKNILAVSNDKPVAIYCRSGNRSTRAMYAMRAIGFSDIISLKSGFKSWKTANKAIKTLEVKGDIRRLDVANFNNAILGNVGILVDVRTAPEYSIAHLPGAINIDYKSPSFKSKFAKLGKEKPVMIYCRSGARSSRAMRILEAEGFKVYNLGRGFLDWKSKGMKIEGKNVHAKDGGEEGC